MEHEFTELGWCINCKMHKNEVNWNKEENKSCRETVYFINTVNRGTKRLMPGTYKTKKEAEERIEVIKESGMLMAGSYLEVEEFAENKK